MNGCERVCGGINKSLITPSKTKYQISPQFINNIKENDISKMHEYEKIIIILKNDLLTHLFKK